MSEDHFLNLQPGTIVNGRYEIVKCLGTGSMGMVYACRHRELSGHLVAMKVLFTEVARDNVAAARFRNEIVASYGVSHPNVVRAYEYFRDGDLVAFTMEYIGGGDLADRIGGDLPMPIPEIVRMLSQMCSGVQAIHEAGIIHRDLKPENILVTTNGDIKITDFGIARTGAGPKLTEHGGVVGTIDYVSPEYLERGQVDARSDIYALGVLAYEMITGEAPFKGKSVIETMTMRLRSDADPPHRLRRECPLALSAIVMRAMTRDPERRYQQAAEMFRDLQNLGDLQAGEENGSARGGAGQSSSGRSQRVLYQDEEPDAGGLFPLNGGALVASDESQDVLSGTLSLTSDEVDSLKGELEGDESEEERADTAKLESVLSLRTGKAPLDESDYRPPSVSVSRSNLSVDRIKELSLDLHAEDESVFAKVFGWFLIIFLGIGVGFLVVRHYSPGGVEAFWQNKSRILGDSVGETVREFGRSILQLAD